jgi:hypothetical protein
MVDCSRATAPAGVKCVAGNKGSPVRAHHGRRPLVSYYYTCLTPPASLRPHWFAFRLFTVQAAVSCFVHRRLHPLPLSLPLKRQHGTVWQPLGLVETRPAKMGRMHSKGKGEPPRA